MNKRPIRNDSGRWSVPLLTLCLVLPTGSDAPAAQSDDAQRQSATDREYRASEPLTGEPVVDVSAAQSYHLTLVIGHAQVLDAGPVRRIAVGNGKVMQATAIDARQVLVLPEAVGQSTLHLWPKRGPMRRYLVTVIASDTVRNLEQVQAMIGVAPNLGARLAGDAVVIEGDALNAMQKARVAAAVERNPGIVNLATSETGERMIAMDVRIVEMKKSALQRIGVRWAAAARGPSFGVVGDFHRSGALSAPDVAMAAGEVVRAAVSPFASALSLATSITSTLDFLVSRGEAVILAEPRLSCRSGGSARFVAGGELPIPQSSGLSGNSVSFKEYGVKFDFSPTAGPGGMIAARIATEVSSVDFETMVQEVPGLIKRRAETEVNLRDNQTLVIAGLLSENAARRVDQLAGLGDLPILGPLFRSRDYRSQKTDLVVFVTPRFVDGDIQLPSEPAAVVDRAHRQLERLRILE